MLKRSIDIILSLLGIIILSPIMIIVSMAVFISMGPPIFFEQTRVGQYNCNFLLLKFRTMHKRSENKGFLTIGQRDSRISAVGYFLRKLKLDELPQLFNVLKGEMSLVGPRPEVRKFVALYNEQQKKVLSVRPGITDYASIKFVRESELLSQSHTPEKLYVEKIMPEKLSLNIAYIDDGDIFQDFKLILFTIWTIIKRS